MTITIHDVIEHGGLIDEPIQFGEDRHGEHFTIFETHEDIAKFIEAYEEMVNEEGLNDFDVERALETNIVFADEYTMCHDCGSIVRISPDSYGWTPEFYIGDGYLVCLDCFNGNEGIQEEYLEERVNNPSNANQLLTDKQLEELGFVHLDHRFESGLHDGQNDDPTTIYDKLKFKYDEILFNIDGTGQFDIHFSVYVRGAYDEEDAV